MLSFFKKIQGLFLSDRKVTAVLYLKAFQGISAFITIGFVSYFLSPEHAGVFYTFLSVLALQVVIELGMAGIIIQASAHEQKYLAWNKYELNDSVGLGKYAALLRFSLKWYLSVSVFVFCFLSLVGFFFFQDKIDPSLIDYVWFSSVLFLSLAMTFIPVFSIFEGAGFISDVAKAKLIQEVLGFAAMWGGMYLGLGLYALPLLFFGKFLVGLIWVLTSWRRAFLMRCFTTDKLLTNYSWFKELYTFQWKIAISWMSGYFAFQAIIPITFALQGPILAGQVGVTLTAINGLSSIAVIWITVNAPKFGSYISQGKFVELNSLFDRSIRFGLEVILLLSILFVIFVVFLGLMSENLRGRFLDNFPLFVFLLSAIANFYVFSYAIYLRSYKKEPLMINSLIGAILTVGVVYLGGLFHSINATSLGYLFITVIVGFLWTRHIYLKHRIISDG